MQNGVQICVWISPPLIPAVGSFFRNSPISAHRVCLLIPRLVLLLTLLPSRSAITTEKYYKTIGRDYGRVAVNVLDLPRYAHRPMSPAGTGPSDGAKQYTSAILDTVARLNLSRVSTKVRNKM